MEGLEYIDNYFKGELTPEQTRQFDKKIVEDPAFAEEVAFYLSSIKLISEQQNEERKARFREIYKNSKPDSADNNITVRTPVKQLWKYIAAAAVVVGVIMTTYLFNSAPGGSELANQYIKANFQNLGVNMGSSQDGLEMGKRLNNDGKLKEALTVFENIIPADSSNFEAKKYAGIVSLRLKEYDKALQYFSELELRQDLLSNPGKFYKALTLMKRGLAGDKEQAKQLLQQVVDNGLEGKETAELWLGKWSN